LVMVVIPLGLPKSIPTRPTVELQKHLDEWTLGTKLAGSIDFDQSLLEKEHAVKINAMKERARLESNGLGDQFNKIQETIWSAWKILAGGFKIDLCFCYQEDQGNEIIQSCQRIVVWIHSDKPKEKNDINVLIEWKDKDVIDVG
jgi:hypothetical protein